MHKCGVTRPRFQLTLHLLRNIAREAAASVLLVAFALVVTSPGKAQQEPPPVPGFLDQFPLAETGRRDLQEPASARQDLPEAPRTLPRQARRMTLGERFRIYRHSLFNP